MNGHAHRSRGLPLDRSQPSTRTSLAIVFLLLPLCKYLRSILVTNSLDCRLRCLTSSAVSRSMPRARSAWWVRAPPVQYDLYIDQMEQTQSSEKNKSLSLRTYPFRSRLAMPMTYVRVRSNRQTACRQISSNMVTLCMSIKKLFIFLQSRLTTSSIATIQTHTLTLIFFLSFLYTAAAPVGAQSCSSSFASLNSHAVKRKEMSEREEKRNKFNRLSFPLRLSLSIKSSADEENAALSLSLTLGACC